MANGDGGNTILAAVAVYLKEKLTLLLWTAFISIAGFMGSYKLVAYRVEQNATEISSIRSTMATKVEEDRKQQEVTAFLQEVQIQMKNEAEERRSSNQLVLQEVRRANERIDALLNALRHRGER